MSISLTTLTVSTSTACARTLSAPCFLTSSRQAPPVSHAVAMSVDLASFLKRKEEVCTLLPASFLCNGAVVKRMATSGFAAYKHNQRKQMRSLYLWHRSATPCMTSSQHSRTDVRLCYAYRLCVTSQSAQAQCWLPKPCRLCVAAQSAQLHKSPNMQ